MEQIGEILKKDAAGSSSLELSTRSLKVCKDQDGYYISQYTGELSKEVVAKSAARIKVAFPMLSDEFVKLLFELARENNFSNERLQDAVMSVIKTCIYPTPTIANFLNYDKKIRLYTYNEVLDKVNQGMKQTNFEAVDVGNEKPMWRMK